MYDEEYAHSQSRSSDKNAHNVLLWFVLQSLLLENSGVTIYACPIWLDVNCSNILFVIISSINKQAIKDCCKPTCSTVVHLPELLQIIILSLLIFDNVDAALLLLLISIICLAFLATVTNTIRSFAVMVTSKTVRSTWYDPLLEIQRTIQDWMRLARPPETDFSEPKREKSAFKGRKDFRDKINKYCVTCTCTCTRSLPTTPNILVPTSRYVCASLGIVLGT